MQTLVAWFEIPVFDLKRAIDFYGHVFPHIRFDVAEFSGAQHAIFKSVLPNSPLKMSGALVEQKEKSGTLYGPVLFFDANLGMSSILESIRKHGGEVLLEKTLIRNFRQDGTIVIPKTLIDGNHGYYAYFKDPEGNKMGLYSNS